MRLKCVKKRIDELHLIGIYSGIAGVFFWKI